MSLTNQEILELQEHLKNLWAEVIESVKITLTLTQDCELVEKSHVEKVEKRINKLDRKVVKKCEKILALYQPLAHDLRIVIASLQINNYLESIGDMAHIISNEILSIEHIQSINKDKALHHIIEKIILELIDTLTSYNKEDADMARGKLNEEIELDKKCKSLKENIIQSLSPNSLKKETVIFFSIVTQLEFIINQLKLISSEVIYIKEAKNIKHKNPDVM